MPVNKDIVFDPNKPFTKASDVEFDPNKPFTKADGNTVSKTEEPVKKKDTGPVPSAGSSVGAKAGDLGAQSIKSITPTGKKVDDIPTVSINDSSDLTGITGGTAGALTTDNAIQLSSFINNPTTEGLFDVVNSNVKKEAANLEKRRTALAASGALDRMATAVPGQFIGPEGPAPSQEQTLAPTEMVDLKNQKGEVSATVEVPRYISKWANNITQNYYSGNLSASDIKVISDNSPLLSGDTWFPLLNEGIAATINDKTKKYRDAVNSTKGNVVENKLMQEDIDRQAEQIMGSVLKSENEGSISDRSNFIKEQQAKLEELHQKKAFLAKSFNDAYQSEKKKVVDNIIGDINNRIKVFGDYDGQTSNEAIRKIVDGYLEDNPNPTLAAANGTSEPGTSGIDLKNGEYIPYKDKNGEVHFFKNHDFEDVAKDVWAYFNVQKPAEDYANQQVFLHNEKMAPLVHFKDGINNYFSTNAIKNLDSVVDIEANSLVSSINKKYQDILASNPRVQNILSDLQVSAQAGASQDQLAKSAEDIIRTDPELSKILDQRDKEVDASIAIVNKKRMDFIINGLKKVYPGLTYGDNGVSVEGATPEELANFKDQYSSYFKQGLDKQKGKLQDKADMQWLDTRKDWNLVPGGATLWAATKTGGINMMESFARYFDLPQMTKEFSTYRADNLLPQSEFIQKHSRWNGISSLLDPSYYLYNVGQSIPYMAPAVIAGVATGGAGGVAVAAGVGSMSETALNMLDTFNDLYLNGTDEFGQKITMEKASQAAANDFAGEVLPNLILAYAEFGALARPFTKSSVLKKSIAGEVKGGLAGLVPVAIEEGAQEGIQGYFQDRAHDIAERGTTKDFFDYMGTDDFRQNFFGGLTGGVGFAIPGATKRIAGAASAFNNWQNILKTANYNFDTFNNNVLRSYALNEEVNGRGAQFRDQLEFRLAVKDYKSEEEKAQLEATYIYSNALKNYSKSANISARNINGLAAAHNLAMYDYYKRYEDAVGSETSMGQINKERAKEHLEEAKRIMGGNTEGTYYIQNKDGHPIFLSQRDAQALTENGNLQTMLNNGDITGTSNNITLGPKVEPAKIQAESAAEDNFTDEEFAAINAINTRSHGKEFVALKPYIDVIHDDNATVAEKRDALKGISDQLLAPGTAERAGEELGQKGSVAIEALGHAAPSEGGNAKNAMDESLAANKAHNDAILDQMKALDDKHAENMAAATTPEEKERLQNVYDTDKSLLQDKLIPEGHVKVNGINIEAPVSMAVQTLMNNGEKTSSSGFHTGFSTEWNGIKPSWAIILEGEPSPEVREAAARAGLEISERFPGRKPGEESVTNASKVTDVYLPGVGEKDTEAAHEAFDNFARFYQQAKDKSAEGVNKAAEDFAKDLDENYEQRKKEYQEKFGNVISADNVRTMSPEYQKNPEEMTWAMREATNKFALRMFNDAIAEKGDGMVLFTAGGSGVGKSSSISEEARQSAEIIYDSFFDNYDDSVKKINKVLASGRSVVVSYVYRDAVDAFTNGVIPRMMEEGRPVPIEHHLNKFEKSLETIEKLQEHYKGNDNVDIKITENVSDKGPQETTVEELKKKPYLRSEVENKLNETVNNLQSTGAITQKQAQALQRKVSNPVRASEKRDAGRSRPVSSEKGQVKPSKAKKLTPDKLKPTISVGTKIFYNGSQWEIEEVSGNNVVAYNGNLRVTFPKEAAQEIYDKALENESQIAKDMAAKWDVSDDAGRQILEEIKNNPDASPQDLAAKIRDIIAKDRGLEASFLDNNDKPVNVTDLTPQEFRVLQATSDYVNRTREALQQTANKKLGQTITELKEAGVEFEDKRREGAIDKRMANAGDLGENLFNQDGMDNVKPGQTLFHILTAPDSTLQQRGMAAAYIAAHRLLGHENSWLSKIFKAAGKKVRIIYNTSDNSTLMAANHHGILTINAFRLGHRLMEFQGEKMFFNWLEMALHEEAIHLAQFKVANEKEMLQIAAEMTQQEKDYVNAVYSGDKLDDYGLASEYVRMIIQQQLFGTTSELLKPKASSGRMPNGGAIRAFLARLVTFLKNALGKSKDKFANQVIRRIELYIVGAQDIVPGQQKTINREGYKAKMAVVSNQYGNPVIRFTYRGRDTHVQQRTLESGKAFIEVQQTDRGIWKAVDDGQKIPGLLGYSTGEAQATLQRRIDAQVRAAREAAVEEMLNPAPSMRLRNEFIKKMKTLGIKVPGPNKTFQIVKSFESQKDFERAFQEAHKNQLTDDPLDFHEVLDGRKKGAWADDVKFELTDEEKQKAKEKGLFYGRILDPLTNEGHVVLGKIEDINKLRNELANPEITPAQYHRALGEFLGYPDEAINFHIKNMLSQEGGKTTELNTSTDSGNYDDEYNQAVLMATRTALFNHFSELGLSRVVMNKIANNQKITENESEEYRDALIELSEAQRTLADTYVLTIAPGIQKGMSLQELTNELSGYEKYVFARFYADKVERQFSADDKYINDDIAMMDQAMINTLKLNKYVPVRDSDGTVGWFNNSPNDIADRAIFSDPDYIDETNDLLTELFDRIGKGPEKVLNASDDRGDRKTEKGAIGVNKQQLLFLLGPSMYSKPLAQVAVKELLQNSFDAVKALQNIKGISEPGDIKISLNSLKRTISIRDNGIGMTPDIVKNAFLSIGGTNKEGLGVGERSGGFGLAKVQFLLGSEYVKVQTVRDGVKTSLTASNIQLYNDDFEIQTEKTDEPNGTFVEVKIPESYTTPEGTTRSIHFPYSSESIDILKRPLLGNVNVSVDYNGQKTTLPLGVNTTEDTLPPLFSKIGFSWGDADLYMGVEKNENPTHEILSSGIFQFENNFRDADWNTVPYDIVVNIKPKVGSNAEQYPFNNQREGFKNTIENDISALTEYILKYARGEAEKEAKTVYENFKPLPKSDPNKILTAEEREKIYSDLEKTIAETKALRSEGNVEQRRVYNISIDNSVLTDLDTGEKTNIEEEKEKQRERTFKAEKDIAENAPIDIANANDKLPQFHNNTNFDYMKIEGAPEFFSDFGSVVLDMVRFAGRELGYEYKKLTGDNEKFFAGVSIDKTYGGVHIRKILNAIFVNPLSFDARSSEEAVGVALHATIHEINHTTASGEGARFTSHLARLYGKIYATGKYGLFEGLFRSVYKKHFETYNKLRNEFDKSSTRNLSDPFQGDELGRSEAGVTEGNEKTVRAGKEAQTRDTGDRSADKTDQAGDVIASKLADEGITLNASDDRGDRSQDLENDIKNIQDQYKNSGLPPGGANGNVSEDEGSPDPVRDFQLVYGDYNIVQDVMLTHMKRDVHYSANPADYERPVILMAVSDFLMREIISDVFSRYKFDDALAYFVDCLKDPSIELPVRELVSKLLIEKFTSRPDIADKLRTRLDNELATKASMSMSARRNFNEPGVIPEPIERKPRASWGDDISPSVQDQITNSVEGGREVLDAQEALLASQDNTVSPAIEKQLADSEKRAEELTEKMDQIKQELEKGKEKVEKKIGNIDPKILKAKSEEAFSRIRMKYPDKKNLVDALKELKRKLDKISKLCG